MARFVAVLTLAMIGMVWFVLADFVQQCALVTAFGAAAMLPLVANPTRYWARAFWLCVDIVYAAACIGAWFGALATHAPRLHAFTASLLPAFVFGTMASLGIGRSGLADLEK